MMPTLWIMRRALKLATSKPVPSKIPLSDQAKLRKRDYTVALLSNGSSSSIFVTSVTPGGVTGELISDGQPKTQQAISNADLPSYNVHFTQYRGILWIKYNSSFSYVLVRTFRLDWLRLGWETISQFLYNQRKLARADRMQVLAHFYEKTREDVEYGAGAEKLLDEMAGPRWGGRDDNAAFFFHTERVLKSLRETGDLRQLARNKYVLNSNALLTLERYETEERRHRDMRRLNFLLVLFAALTALIPLGIWLLEKSTSFFDV